MKPSDLHHLAGLEPVDPQATLKEFRERLDYIIVNHCTSDVHATRTLLLETGASDLASKVAAIYADCDVEIDVALEQVKALPNVSKAADSLRRKIKSLARKLPDRYMPEGKGPKPEPDVWQQLDRKPHKVDGEIVGYKDPYPTALNFQRVIENDSRWRGRLHFNDFDGLAYLDSEAMSDNEEMWILLWVARVYRFEISVALAGQLLNHIAREHPYHPVRDYLNAQVWDGTRRLDHFLENYLGAEDSQLNREMGVKFLVSCVARVMEPGCKVDTTLILRGEQGIKKSTAFQRLAYRQEWFSDSIIDFRSKDSYQVLRGTWIQEFGELDSMKRSDTSALKAFLTTLADKFRPSYARNLVRWDRQTVFVGTTNDEEFLKDPTGSRRFWTVEVGEPDIEAIDRDREQLWAEAVVAFRSGCKWWLDKSADKALAAQNARYQQDDPWLEPVAIYCATRQTVTMNEIFGDVIKKELQHQTGQDYARLRSVLTLLGYAKTGIRRRIAGLQVRVWERDGDVIRLNEASD